MKRVVSTCLHVLLPVLVSVSSCSIKTDRTLCPCLVSLRVSGGDENIVDVDVCCDTWGQRTQSSKEGGDALFNFSLPRDSVRFFSRSGVHNCELRGDSLIVPFGSEMDQVFASSMKLYLDGDYKKLSTTLHKQFAMLNLSIISSSEAMYPYYIKLSGTGSGFSLSDLEALSGPFEVLIHPVVGEYHRVCLPRQKEDSLMLEFFDRSMTKADDAPVDVLPLGDLISKEGFDWSSEDLQDLFIDIDYSDAGVNITIAPWEKIDLI